MDRNPDLEKQAAAGDVAAQLALAQTLERAGQTLPARGWYARAAQSGDPAGLRGLGGSLLTKQPYGIEDGIRFMRGAADQGDAEALRICATLAAQDTDLVGNWEVALDFLERAAERGSALAQGELTLLARDTSGNPNWKTLRAAIDTARWHDVPLAKTISESPRLKTIENFAAPEVCDWLIARSKDRVGRALVYDPKTGGAGVEEHRTNGAANFDLTNWDLQLVLLRTRIAKAVGLPVHCLEHPTVLHYEPGQEFEPHFDFLDPQSMALKREIALQGQRVATVLVYLNDDYEGAETEFTELGIHHRGKKGDALLFWNLDASGSPDRRTRHAGRPPLSGRKWVLSQWVRQEKPRQRGALAVHQS